MADFCKACSIAMFGEDSRDLAFHDWQEPKELAFDEGYPAICEGCGFIRVDGDGQCTGDAPEQDTRTGVEVGCLQHKQHRFAYAQKYGRTVQEPRTA